MTLESSAHLGGGLLLTFGGVLHADPTVVSGETWLIDLVAKTAVNVTGNTGAAPAPRAEAVTTSDGAGIVYMIGGCFDAPGNSLTIFCARFATDVRCERCRAAPVTKTTLFTA
jgi:hypothetical protein